MLADTNRAPVDAPAFVARLPLLIQLPSTSTCPHPLLQPSPFPPRASAPVSMLASMFKKRVPSSAGKGRHDETPAPPLAGSSTTSTDRAGQLIQPPPLRPSSMTGGSCADLKPAHAFP